MAKLATFLRSRQKGWELDRYEFSPWWHKYSMFLNSFLPNLQGEKYSFAEVTLTRLVPFWGDLPYWVWPPPPPWMVRKTNFFCRSCSKASLRFWVWGPGWPEWFPSERGTHLWLQGRSWAYRTMMVGTSFFDLFVFVFVKPLNNLEEILQE